MLTDINTKEFWEQVKKEYKPNSLVEFGFCGSSSTFRTMWSETDNELRKDYDVMLHAQNFLEAYSSDSYSISTQYLFEPMINDTLDCRIKIRKDFLDYMINKFP